MNTRIQNLMNRLEKNPEFIDCLEEMLDIAESNQKETVTLDDAEETVLSNIGKTGSLILNKWLQATEPIHPSSPALVSSTRINSGG